MALFSSSAAPHRPYAAWEEAELLAALRADDAPAFREIYERYWYGLYATALRKLGSETLAEEMVQDLFAALWHKRATAYIEQLPAYLHAALRYRVIDWLKAQHTRAQYAARQQQTQADISHATEEAVAAADLSQALAASLEALPAQTREVFRLRRLEHQSVAETATRLHLSPKAVEYHLTRALKLLRQRLKDFLVLAAILFW